MNQLVYETHFSELKLLKRGKVRDIYDLGDCLLMVATDRLSAFDVVMPDPIPDKGKVLTQISLFWFQVMQSIIPNHIITCNINEYPEVCRPYLDVLKDRSMIVKKANPLTVECVVRGYLSGSGWNSYQENKQICGISLPEGLRESDRLPEPIFTPTTKEEQGKHDMNIDFNTVVDMVGSYYAEKIRDLSISIFQKGSELAEKQGIIIADTKFEFGIIKDELVLIDEVLTPDSSRFWPKKHYKPGCPQNSFDKQYVRDYLLSLKWNKKPPGPTLPQDIILNTAQKYRDALALLTRAIHA
ncbi:MAG: phosphoribosylaminoimidazolesuccinocarboxamide synthase [Desulfobacterales bacterium]|nr:phosphoribosylaminoimidazolesuccinocarboxamide synthase [Desulfobacterales bacterium]